VDVALIDVAVKCAVETPRADGNGRDGGKAVMTVAMPQDWCLAHGTPRLAHGWNQEEAGFVDEDEVGSQPSDVFFTRGQTAFFHRVIATSLRSIARRLRLLVAPSQLVEESADVITMILHSKAPLDQYGNPLSGPKFRPGRIPAFSSLLKIKEFIMATATFKTVGFCAHYSKQGDWAFGYALDLSRRHSLKLNVFHFLEDPYPHRKSQLLFCFSLLNFPNLKTGGHI
jgi:hypothetical protein